MNLPSQSTGANPRDQVTFLSLTLALAYLQYYTPKLLPRGRFLAANHLRTLSAWIGRPDARLRSIRAHRSLAAHFALLHAAGLLCADGSRLVPHPTVIPWLHAPMDEKLTQIAAGLGQPEQWAHTLQVWGWESLFPEVYTVYLQQSLARQARMASAPDDVAVRWLAESDDEWQLALPPELPLWLHFDLRQLGFWQPHQPLTLTPFTVAQAAQRGYSARLVQWLLETAVGAPLTLPQQQTIRQWRRRATTYSLRPVWLLSTAQPEQLAAIARQKRLREAMSQQLSPRHAVIREDLAPRIVRWLQQQGYPLPELAWPGAARPAPEPAAYHWLGLRLLVGLGELIPLPYPPPHGLLESAAQCLSPQQQSALEELAQAALANVRSAIRGRDAFFPARQPVSGHVIDQVRQAIFQESDLCIFYQALLDHEPRWRCIQPLRLEQRGALYYLHAYCYRAEKNLLFRLDRVVEVRSEK